MLHVLTTWLLVVAFFGVGVFNAISTPATQAGFIRWGYPAWWGRVTGALEIAAAALIAFPVTRIAGLILAAAVIAAAIVTVVRHREFAHLAPLGVFVALIALAELSA